MSHALLMVPPLVKYTAGPMLGPALLAGSAADAGHSVQVVDLNARYLRHVLPASAWGWTPSFLGDHDKPVDHLARAEADFISLVAKAARCDEVRVRAMTLAHDDVDAAATALARSPFGDWVRTELARCGAPDLVGVSVLFSGQVLPALAISIATRSLWPNVRVVWGGAHVTALRDVIAADARYGRHVDGFVLGHATATFVDLLDGVRESRMPGAVLRAGAGDATTAIDREGVVPRFDDLGLYDDAHLTLPAQTSRGCAYGRCRFCTYPAVEGKYEPMSLAVLDAIVEKAVAVRASIALKDSLLTTTRLREVAERIGGRVRWSGCTKLQAGLDETFLRTLRTAGCTTLEVGLETLDPAMQQLIDKVQSPRLLLQLLDAASATGLALVINTMSGFPGEIPQNRRRWAAWLRAEIAARPALISIVEHNMFQLERLSPMARHPSAAGVRILESWPWSSILSYEALRRRGRLRVVA